MIVLYRFHNKADSKRWQIVHLSIEIRENGGISPADHSPYAITHFLTAVFLWYMPATQSVENQLNDYSKVATLTLVVTKILFILFHYIKHLLDRHILISFVSPLN